MYVEWMNSVCLFQAEKAIILTIPIFLPSTLSDIHQVEKPDLGKWVFMSVIFWRPYWAPEFCITWIWNNNWSLKQCKYPKGKKTRQITCRYCRTWPNNKEERISDSGNQLCPTLWDPMDCIVREILQARMLEWVAFTFSRGSSQPRNQIQVSWNDSSVGKESAVMQETLVQFQGPEDPLEKG